MPWLFCIYTTQKKIESGAGSAAGSEPKILKILIVILCPFLPAIPAFTHLSPADPTVSAEQWTHLTYQAIRRKVSWKRLSSVEAAIASTCFACSSGTPPTHMSTRMPRSRRFIIVTLRPSIRMIIARSRVRIPSRRPFDVAPVVRAIWMSFWLREPRTRYTRSRRRRVLSRKRRQVAPRERRGFRLQPALRRLLGPPSTINSLPICATTRTRRAGGWSTPSSVSSMAAVIPPRTQPLAL